MFQSPERQQMSPESSIYVSVKLLQNQIISCSADHAQRSGDLQAAVAEICKVCTRLY